MLENSDGAAGFKGDRRTSSVRISTGTTVNSPCEFDGTHDMYLLAEPPDFEIILLKRRNVSMMSDFRKALFSPSVAFTELGIKSEFNDRPRLVLPDGALTPSAFVLLDGGGPSLTERETERGRLPPRFLAPGPAAFGWSRPVGMKRALPRARRRSARLSITAVASSWGSSRRSQRR